MCSSPASWNLIEAGFEDRLVACLERARQSLGVELAALVELSAPNGILQPEWRAVVPGELQLSTVSYRDFKGLTDSSEPVLNARNAGMFHESLSDMQWSACALRVVPSIHADWDTALVLAFRQLPPASEVAELKSLLEQGLSQDRSRRLADAMLAAVQQAGDPIELTDSQARLLYANTAWEKTFGYALRDVAGRTVGRLFRDPINPVHDQAFYQFTLERLSQGNSWLGVIASRTHSGESVFCEAHVSPFSAVHTRLQGNFAVRRRLDHRAERDKALTLAHQEFRAVLAAMPDGVVVLRGTKVYFANAAFLETVGRQEAEAIGRDYVEFIHPEDREHFKAEHRHEVVRVRLLRNGAPRFAEISTAGAVSFEAKPATILLSRDTTDYSIAQEELARAEKLSALGALAAGVAHEINNPLAYVTLNLQQVLETAKSKLSPSEVDVLEEASEGAARMKRIVSELKGFSGADRPGPLEAVDVVQSVTSALNIAQNEIRHRARLERDHAPGLFVLAREGQLVQVLVNVLVNAAQAIPMISRGEQLIRVTSKRVSEAEVEITISDSGTGIPEELIEHVFDPFATAKQRGEGSGLGLTISKRIVDELGGSIRIHTERGVGTTVKLRLPRAVASRRAPASQAPPRARREGPRARVLIVDDELAVAKGLKRMLSRHEVVIARDGTEALTMIRAGTAFDVVLCDLMMPGLSGPELYQSVAGEQPELSRRFIFMTGGAFTDYGRAFLETVGCPILKKPFDREAVLDSIDDVVHLKHRMGQRSS